MSPELADAVNALHQGGLVVYPTDTLWGLGCNPFDEQALTRLQELKGRRSGGFSVLVADLDDIWRLGRRTPAAERIAERFLPGALTLVLPAAHPFPAVVTVGGTVGLRIPDHPIARELARRAGPVIGTSANRHDEPPPRTLAEVRAALGEGPVYLDGPLPAGHASTVVDLSGEVPVLVREGALAWEEVRRGA